MKIDFGHLKFRYEPFPIGLASNIFADDVYDALVAAYPSRETFERARAGVKYVLSDRINGREYFRFLRATPIWREFYDCVTSDAFIAMVLEQLAANHIRLGYVQRAAPLSYLRHLAYGIAGRVDHRCSLRSRFEFSMLPADGGSVTPHTDSPGKVITLVLPMIAAGEWRDEIGGGTDVNRPKSERLMFNDMNEKAEFDELEVVDTFPFHPNQAVVFIRTYNSWHSVRPMTAAGSKLMRKSVTINIMTP